MVSSAPMGRRRPSVDSGASRSYTWSWTRWRALDRARFSSRMIWRSPSISGVARLSRVATSDMNSIALVERVLARPRQRELVRRLIEAREGVLVAPEREAQRLKERHHGARREIGRSVERHVLEVVREAARGVGLVERARGDVEPDAHAALGILVRANDVAEPIGERARHERGIRRQPVVGRPRRDLCTHHHRQHQQDQDSPHRASSKFNAPPVEMTRVRLRRGPVEAPSGCIALTP